MPDCNCSEACQASCLNVSNIYIHLRFKHAVQGTCQLFAEDSRLVVNDYYDKGHSGLIYNRLHHGLLGNIG